MRTITWFSILVVVACSCKVARSQGTLSTERTSQDNALAQKVVAGDRDTIQQVGKSGNQFFVPYLRQALKTRPNKGEGFKHYWPEELALARLGQVQQLQEFWCSAIADDPKHQLTPSIEQLDLIGGWFAIQGLEKFLSPEEVIHWHKPTRQEKDSDTADLPAPVQAMITLSKVVPNPPVPPTPIEALKAQTQRAKYIKIWQDWIAAHKDELSKLQPTGEGVDFKACKNGKPRKKP